MKLATFTILGGVALSALVAGLTAYNTIWDAKAQDRLASSIDSITAGLADTRDLTRAVDEVKFDVVQVQQWLTDVSATRGLDGLNDGFDKAESFAAKLSADVDRAST